MKILKIPVSSNSLRRLRLFIKKNDTIRMKRKEKEKQRALQERKNFMRGAVLGLLFYLKGKSMDFGKGYYKAYLNNNHTWWGISF